MDGQDGRGQIVSVEFEVYGQVQGVYFTKYCREMSEKLGLGGWVKNSKSGSIIGKIQGERTKVNQMADWLSRTGSPGCRIEHAEFRSWEYMARQEFRNFSVRF
ncbi:acylphosphatase-2-like [Bacillus rossius redtenbacheri]|uniref:acylphosphatase-2-like n=1 Tax=Bacillus rossius redtenbacheri TaxID=93214 RepID=UPI002FDDE9D2